MVVAGWGGTSLQEIESVIFDEMKSIVTVFGFSGNVSRKSSHYLISFWKFCRNFW